MATDHDNTNQNETQETVQCACGCGQEVPANTRGSQYIHGHNRRKRYPKESISCACGCGNALFSHDTRGEIRRYIQFHYNRKSIQIAFWNRVIKTESCWIWTGCKDPRGYGSIIRDSKTIKTHRFSWELHYGSIPNELCVLHQCDNPPCVNPAHLFLGTPTDNMRDASKKHRLSHGENHFRSKLTIEQVLTIKRLYVPYKYSQKRLAKEYGVDADTIGSIVYGKTWKSV